MTADADKPAKMRAERTAKVQESLRMLHDAHAQARVGVRGLQGSVGSLGPADKARHAAVVEALAGLQGGYEQVVGVCREQGVTA